MYIYMQQIKCLLIIIHKCAVQACTGIHNELYHVTYMSFCFSLNVRRDASISSNVCLTFSTT